MKGVPILIPFLGTESRDRTLTSWTLVRIVVFNIDTTLVG